MIIPNEHADWINKRNSIFEDFIPIDPEKKFDTQSKTFFTVYSLGLNSNRDAWVYNSSNTFLINNIKKHISFYNQQVEGYKIALEKNDKLDVNDFKDNTQTKISWSSSLEDNLRRLNKAKFEKDKIEEALYRPFFKQFLYHGEKMIHRPGQFSHFFPTDSTQNYLISINGVGFRKDSFSCVMTNKITDLEYVEKTQCFPLYWYEKKSKIQSNLFEKVEDEYTRHDAISDFIYEQAKTRYGPRVTKEDIFYYVYGILHSPDYRKTFANDLKKMLPRLPLVEKPADFWAFSTAGRKLADIHLNYEEQKKPEEVKVSGMEKGIFTVDKMRFVAKKWGEGKWGDGKWGETKKDEIIYNAHITIFNIPAKAYEYIVNSKSAIEWVMERYAVTTHKESGIKNDPNDWAKEHGNPQYILDLLLSVISVSIETVDIVAGLPKVEFNPNNG